MSIRKLIVWITFLAVFAMAARVSVDTDTWWHLRAGQWIWEHRTVPQQDHFSYTRAGEAWQYPGWLVEVPMYGIYQALGPGGLNLWTAAMVTLAFWFVWQTLSGGSFLKAFVTILAATASGVYWAARPYLVTFVLAAVYLWILENDRRTWHAHSQDNNRRGLKRLWLLPLLMIIWANSHGGFAVGLILWGVYLVGALVDGSGGVGGRGSKGAGERGRVGALLFVGALMLLAVCINPSGPVMLLYPFKTMGIGALQDYIQEWQSPDFHQTQVQPFLWLLLLLLGVLGVSKRRILWTDFLLVSGFAYLGFMAGRNISLFALVAPMVLTRHAAPPLRSLGKRWGFQQPSSGPVRVSRGKSILNWTLLGILILAAGVKSALVYPPKENEKIFQQTLPIDAVEYLRQERPEGRIFNSYNWGGYLLWALPEYPVFVDGRTDLYGDEIVDQWVQVVAAEAGWQAVLDDWGVNLILLEPHRPLVADLEAEGWRLLYEDEVAVVYGRK
ncbi:MAG: hypothetical protein U9Q82_16340 [Chloroflexota bacterium]|nr:hypothetical protein [Chloroflexota bacterium]